jgi:hypothetical protein
MKQHDFHWKDFHKIWYYNIFPKPVEKIQFLLKSDKNNGYFTWRPMHSYDSISLNSSENKKCFREIVEKIKTYLVSNNFFPKNAYFDIMWKITVQPDRPQMTV